MTAAGVLPDSAIRQLIARGALRADPEILDDQVQPASLDLRLGPVAYRVRASFLAGQGRTVASRIAEFEMHRVDLTQGAVLEKGCVYLIPLAERLSLPPGVTAVANAKSSSGEIASSQSKPRASIRVYPSPSNTALMAVSKEPLESCFIRRFLPQREPC